ncbi:hypothetical protein GQ42DRAFT_180290 [Ramicandelaber brevisporus]|nr:hypothetical protein GQ42DRAFT_180290 [Ramicandelaber brevisporus]
MAIEQARRELDIRQEDVRQRRERMFDTGLWLEREQQHLADGRVTLQQSEIILDETKRMRRQRIADLVRVLMRMYPMEIIGESTIDIAYSTSMEAAENGSAVSNAIIRVDNGYKPPQQLCIRGIPLSFPLRLPLSSSDDYAAISTALGYVATVVTTVANAIERPLRFPIVSFGSTSVIYDTTSQFRSTYGGTTSPRSRGSHLRTASDASTAVVSHPAVPRLIAQQRQRRRRQLQMSQFNPPLPPPSLPTASSTANDNTADDMMPPPSPSVRKPLSNIPELSRIATVPAASISSVLASVASSAAAPITPVVRAVFGGDTFKREFEQAYDLGACCPLYITPAMGNALHAGGSSALNSASLSMGSPGSDTHGGSEAGEAYRFLRGVGLLVANIKQLMYDEHVEVDDGPIDILADLQKLLDSLMLVPPPKDPSSMPSSPQFVPSLCVSTY